MAALTMISGLTVSNAAPLLISRGSLQHQLGKPKRHFVRCSGGEQKIEQQPEQSNQPTIPSSPSPSPPPTKQPSPSTKFWDVLAFNGPAPERINGRLAMVGFVAAIGAELASGESVVAQLANGGFPWFVGTAVIFSLASLVPLFKGVSVESKSGDIMSSDAELWNGRFAMLGLVALVFTEYLKGGAFV